MHEKYDFEKTYLLEIFGRAAHQEKVIRIMNRQPEGTMTWERYRAIMVNDSRISAGKEFINQHREDLKRAENIYGIRGNNSLNNRYRNALRQDKRQYKSNRFFINSAFDYPRRAKFFKTQLEEFLLLSREENFNPELLEGSIAGAMGYGQFMPDSYRNYAVDFDADGIRDILNNPVDAIGSVANFLNKKGKWKPNTPVAIKANATKEINSIKSTFKPYMTSLELEKIGLESTETIPGNLKLLPISLDLSEGYEYWIGFDNYQSISRYNRSKLYVMAVFEFSNVFLNFYNMKKNRFLNYSLFVSFVFFANQIFF